MSGHTVGNVVDETGSEGDAISGRMDRRSVTMAAENVFTAVVQQAPNSMPPPPRPCAPVAPMTPATPGTSSWNTSHAQIEAGPSSQQGRVESPVPELPAISEKAVVQKAKRPADSLGPQDPQQSPQSPSKKPKTSAAASVSRQSLKSYRDISMLEVGEMEFVFRDARCGAGWYVIRCYTGKAQNPILAARFRRHPLKNNLALEHFNQKSPCHPAPRGNPKSKYTEEKILERFAHRVYDDVIEKTDPTDEMVNESNDKLRQQAEEESLPDIELSELGNKGKGKMKATKGKTRLLGDARFERADSPEPDDIHHEEEVVSYLVPKDAGGDGDDADDSTLA
ncbi:hypothetical protein N0V82_000923 [Gnomoniopsis sp. IMI 355080]|nr:hypothetical protein N0V82_000923 [Gnomoniopsis sp. IMI 355080]